MSTKIEWCHGPDGAKGESWNPFVGCKKISSGCANCYAEREAGRGRLQRFPQYQAVITSGKWNGEVCMANQKMLEKPLHWKKPRKIFVCSMGDYFYPPVGSDCRHQALQIMLQASQHTYLILTKRPEAAALYLRYPDYVWLGTSCENQKWYDKRVPELLKCDAKTRFFSIEPMLGPIDLHSLEGISWVIFGGESGIGARPFDLDWLWAGIAQCDAAGVPVFCKQMGRHPVAGGVWCKHIRDPKGANMDEWPEEVRRREFPKPT
jgi:protein gp37